MENKTNIENNNQNISDIDYIAITCKLPKDILERLLYESRYTGIQKDALICIAVCHFLAMQEKYKLD